jgi:hypothetical protein
LRITQQVTGRSALQKGLDAFHRFGELALLGFGQAFEQGDDFILGSLLQRCEHGAAMVAEVQLHGPRIGGAADFLDQRVFSSPAVSRLR